MKARVLLFLGLTVFLLGCTQATPKPLNETTSVDKYYSCEKDLDCVGFPPPLEPVECREGFIAEPLCDNGKCKWGCSEFD